MNKSTGDTGTGWEYVESADAIKAFKAGHEPELPEFVRILGHNYKVELTEGMLRDWNKWGQVNTRSQIIQIDDSTTFSQQMNSLVHEVLEVIDELLGLGLEHKTLQAIATGVYTVLADNADDLETVLGSK